MSLQATEVQDFRTGVGQWPTEVPNAEIGVDDRYRVVGEDVIVAAPWTVSGSANRIIEAQMTLHRGRVGVFCRGEDVHAGRGEGGQDSSLLSGYRVSVSDSNQFLLERISEQGHSVLAEGELPGRVTTEPGEPMLLRLICTRSKGTMLIGMTFNGSSWQTVTDRDPVQAPDPHAVGIFVDGDVTFDGVALLEPDL